MGNTPSTESNTFTVYRGNNKKIVSINLENSDGDVCINGISVRNHYSIENLKDVVLTINGTEVDMSTIIGAEMNNKNKIPPIVITVIGNCSNVSNVHGEISIEGNANKASSVSGNVKVNFPNSNENREIPCKINTVSGDVNVQGNITGSVKTTSGKVKANNIYNQDGKIGSFNNKKRKYNRAFE